jgi:hypothetical protein
MNDFSIRLGMNQTEHKRRTRLRNNQFDRIPAILHIAAMSSSNSPTPKDGVSAESRALRRKQKAEAHLTSGCGFGKEKRRLIDEFWSSMWPGLEKLGWTKVRDST